MSEDESKVAEKSPHLLISICIPTYQRPDLLTEALNSCFSQTYPHYEIVIGDDSHDNLTEQLVQHIKLLHPDQINYMHHIPSLGQNGNVNDLFARVIGNRLILLHDDDLLLPDTLKKLAGLWDRMPELDAAFGKQYLIEHDGGLVAKERTEALNSGYHRIASNSGRQPLPVIAGLLRMFPNDGFMVSTKLARDIGYRSMEQVGHACDTDFGLRLCAAAQNIWFLDEFTLKYRLSSESISKYSIVDPYTYDMLATLTVPPVAKPTLDKARQDIAPGAISGFAQLGRSKRAWQIFWSPDYSLRRRFTVRGGYHLMLIFRSIFGKPSRRA